MRHILFVILGLLLLISCQVKSYEYIANAQKAYYKKDYNKSIRYYKKLISQANSEDRAAYYVDLACVYVALEDEAQAIHFLRQALDAGYLTALGISCEPRLEKLQSHQSWPALLNIEQEQVENYIQETRQPTLARALVAMYQTDQYQRYRIVEKLGPEYGFRSQEVMQAYFQQTKTDSLNQAKLDSIVAKNGFPKISEVGQLASSGAFHIVQHAPMDYQRDYLPILQTLVNSGELNPQNLAFLKDRILVREDKKQIYGTQLSCRNDTCVVSPLEDPKGVDELRIAIGLLPLDDHLEIRSLKDGRVYLNYSNTD